MLRIFRRRPVLPLALMLLPGTDGPAWLQNLLDVEMTWGDRLRAEGRVEGRVDENRTPLYLVCFFNDGR